MALWLKTTPVQKTVDGPRWPVCLICCVCTRVCLIHLCHTPFHTKMEHPNMACVSVDQNHIVNYWFFFPHGIDWMLMAYVPLVLKHFSLGIHFSKLHSIGPHLALWDFMRPRRWSRNKYHFKFIYIYMQLLYLLADNPVQFSEWSSRDEWPHGLKGLSDPAFTCTSPKPTTCHWETWKKHIRKKMFKYIEI